jgi:hypothetical protein
MEGLHFQSEREASRNPTPLLLAAILYVSSLHHTSEELAVLAPEYFRAIVYLFHFCVCFYTWLTRRRMSIAELSIPSALKQSGIIATDETATPSPTAEQNAFQNVLGLILAGLISEAFIDLTGIWISIGYRLILDHCPVFIDERASKWCQLFSGLQVGAHPFMGGGNRLNVARSLTSNMLPFIYPAQWFHLKHLYHHYANCRALRKIHFLDLQI